ncbi:MAG: sigma-E processing peptidase SpoIIGA [Clostridia bacterium]|nr:sigma-E processing peptidase SpoIIGA [Clostridia bacterium]MBQ7289261.1 sigma-E processing peptidase SpoIIGA [Clostridia bacterium]
MKIYLDSLFLLNFVMSYFLIGLTAHFGAKNTKTKRLVLSGLVGAACAFYIFLPVDVIWLHIAVKLLSAVFILLTAFGFGSMKRFLRLSGFFVGFTFLFGGFFLAMANLLPQDMRQIQNGIIYIDFSPLVFLISAAVCYLLIYLFKNLFGRKEASGCATAYIQIGHRKHRCTVLLDNGHTLRDVFTDLPVLVVSVNHPTPLLDEAERRSVMEHDYISLTQAGFRLIPCKTVANNGLLAVRRADKTVLELPKGKRIAFAAIIGFTGQKLSDDFSGVVSPCILNEV